MLTDNSIQSMGGKARAEALSDEQRKDIARKAAEARWALPKVGWEGEMTVGPLAIKCGVIPPKTDKDKPLRVISETAFMDALGMYRSGALSVRREVSETGAQIPLSLAFKNLKPFIIKHLGDVHFQPEDLRNMDGCQEGWEIGEAPRGYSRYGGSNFARSGTRRNYCTC